MKKLFALLTVVLFAGFMMAQNTSTATQNGPDNTATINQTGSGNSSLLLQESAIFFPRGMTATVDQTGTSNTSDIYQGLYGEHFAVVNQGGTANKAQVVSLRNNETANILQQGNGNDAYQRLHGNLGETTVEQIGNGNQSDQNIGIYGTSGINNTFKGYQTGNNNQLTQTLSTNYDFISAGNSGMIEQIGSENISTQSIGTVASYSSDNSVTAEINGDGNETSQIQQGDLNNSTVKIGFQVNPTYLSDNNMASVEQFGNSNQASFGLTMGDYNDVSISQTGDLNYTELSVMYGDNNQLTENVLGDNNRTRFNMSAPWPTKSSDNIIDISKDGNHNYVAGSITGDDNEVNISQEGNDNFVGTSWFTGDGVKIIGDLNSVDITQTGNGNVSLNSINGNGNMISVNQSN